MGYTVETALSLRGQPAQESSAAARRQLATRHGCDAQYFTHAVEGRGKNSHRLAVVHTATFPEATLSTVIEYVRAARRECKVRVECVYEEGPKCHMAYASGRYIKLLPRDEGRALRASLEKKCAERAHRELRIACTSRPSESQKKMSHLYTHARYSHEPLGEEGEAQEDPGGAMRVPVQIQAEGAQRVPGNGKG